MGMMVPVMMNADGSTTLLGQNVATVPNMMMPPLAPSPSFLTSTNLHSSTATNTAALGTNSSTTTVTPTIDAPQPGNTSQSLQQQQQVLHQVNSESQQHQQLSSHQE